MSTNYVLGFTLLTFLLVGCADKSLTKEEVQMKAPLNENTSIVINKSIKECAEHKIALDRERITDFMLRTPKDKIDQAAMSQEKTSKELCQFFEQETSLEKVEKANILVNNIMASCQKVGVQLSEQGIENKVMGLPLMVIEKGLRVQNESTVQECELMKKRYQ